MIGATLVVAPLGRFPRSWWRPWGQAKGLPLPCFPIARTAGTTWRRNVAHGLAASWAGITTWEGGPLTRNVGGLSLTPSAGANVLRSKW